jgi:hypothetical protein
VPYLNVKTLITQIFRAHLTITASADDYVGANPDNKDADLDRLLFSKADRIEAQIMSLQSTRAADMAAKMIVFCEVHAPDIINPDAPV